MTREDEIAERLDDSYRHLGFTNGTSPRDDIAYLLTRVRQLEGRLPPTSVDVAAVRERLEKAKFRGKVQRGTNGYANIVDYDGEDIVGVAEVYGTEDRRQFFANAPTDIAALLAELDRLRGDVAMLISDNDSERVQAAVWETQRQVALECLQCVSPWFDAYEAIRRRFGLEEQR